MHMTADENHDIHESHESPLRVSTKQALEALVLVAEDPLPTNLLGQLLEMSPVVVEELLDELAAGYEAEGRGFQLVQVGGGWRYQSHPSQAAYVERFVLEGQTSRMSAAALETLAIVAYKQPISRAQVASIRGVSVDGVMRTLQQRGYIAEIGKDPGPGQAILFGTTPVFVEKLGINSLDELPPLGDFVPNAEVVEQLERGLRPDREPLRTEDFVGDDTGTGSGSDDADDGQAFDVDWPDDAAVGGGFGPDAFGDDDEDENEVAPGGGFEGRTFVSDPFGSASNDDEDGDDVFRAVSDDAPDDQL